MSKDNIFVKTAKAERDGSKLSADLKRLLSFMDGKTRSSELSKRAPPSLRKKWNELVTELVEDGYLVDNPEANIEQVKKSVSKPEAALPAGLTAAERVVAELEAAAAADKLAAEVKAKAEAEAKRQNDIAAARVVAELEAAAAAAKVTSEVAKAEAKQADEKAARANELKAFFAAAKEKAKAEAKQAERDAAHARAEQAAAAATAKERAAAEAKAKAAAKRKEEEAAHARAELEAAVEAAKIRSDALAKAKADAKESDEEAARARAELEAAILSGKVKSDAEAKTRQDAEAAMPTAASSHKHVPSDSHPEKGHAKFGEVDANEVQRLRDLEMENESLKKLLVEAYMEIAVLKASSGIKP